MKLENLIKKIKRLLYRIKYHFIQGNPVQVSRSIEDLLLDLPSEKKHKPLVIYFNIKKEKRTFHAYCIGLPRSGTHSIAYALGSYYNSLHEPSARATIELIMKYHKGVISTKETKNILAKRDYNFNLDLEASHYLHHIVNLLTELFPEAKYILTVRNPYSWLKSEINKNIQVNSYFWGDIQKFRYGRYDFNFDHEDEILRTYQGVYPIKSYIQYWYDHLKKILEEVPKDKLLILKTEELQQSWDKIAYFLEISPNSLDIKSGYSNRGSNHLHVNLSDLIRQEYLDDLIRQKKKDIESIIQYEL